MRIVTSVAATRMMRQTTGGASTTFAKVATDSATATASSSASAPVRPRRAPRRPAASPKAVASKRQRRLLRRRLAPAELWRLRRVPGSPTRSRRQPGKATRRPDEVWPIRSFAGLLAAAFLVRVRWAIAAEGSLPPGEVQWTFFNGPPFTAPTPADVKFKLTFSSDGKVTRKPLGRSGAKGVGNLKAQQGRVLHDVAGRTVEMLRRAIWSAQQMVRAQGRDGGRDLEQVTCWGGPAAVASVRPPFIRHGLRGRE